MMHLIVSWSSSVPAAGLESPQCTEVLGVAVVSAGLGADPSCTPGDCTWGSARSGPNYMCIYSASLLYIDIDGKMKRRV